MTRETDTICQSLADLCKRQGVTCLIQVGAEDGYEADCVRKATECQAIAIDGDPQCSPCSSAIDFNCILIGATDCVMPFYLHKTSGLSSQFQREDSQETMVEMQQYRLDTFCTLNDIAPDALIIDTEGTTLDVLEGCGSLLDSVKLIYAEVQSQEIRPGMRLLTEVDVFLAVRGFTQHLGLPSYTGGAQGNYTWVKT